jgi:hypothetical protein
MLGGNVFLRVLYVQRHCSPYVEHCLVIPDPCLASRYDPFQFHSTTNHFSQSGAIELAKDYPEHFGPIVSKRVTFTLDLKII